MQKLTELGVDPILLVRGRALGRALGRRPRGHGGDRSAPAGGARGGRAVPAGAAPGGRRPGRASPSSSGAPASCSPTSAACPRPTSSPAPRRRGVGAWRSAPKAASTTRSSTAFGDVPRLARRPVRAPGGDRRDRRARPRWPAPARRARAAPTAQSGDANGHQSGEIRQSRLSTLARGKSARERLGRRMDGRYVGERLRAIRRQKGLSLHDVEARSDQEFKASVLGAYERGERAISVPRLLRLAELYRVPADQLLPRAAATSRSTSPSRTTAVGEGFTIDLVRLHEIDDDDAAVLARVRGHDPAAAPGLQRPDAHDPPRRPPGARGGDGPQPRGARQPARRRSACAPAAA